MVNHWINVQVFMCACLYITIQFTLMTFLECHLLATQFAIYLQMIQKWILYSTSPLFTLFLLSSILYSLIPYLRRALSISSSADTMSCFFERLVALSGLRATRASTCLIGNSL